MQSREKLNYAKPMLLCYWYYANQSAGKHSYISEYIHIKNIFIN